MKSPATILLFFVLFSCTGLHKLHGQVTDSLVIAHRIDSLHEVTRQLAGAGKIDEALALNAEVEKMVLTQFGSVSAGYGKYCLVKGEIYYYSGDFAKSIQIHLEALDIFMKTVGKEHPDYATILNNLGGLYQSMGQYDKAEGYYLECKQIQEKTLGKEHPSYATTLNNLGNLYESMGQYDKAEGYYLECKQIQEKTLGKEHPSYATTLSNLGNLYESMGQYDKAEGYYLECKQIEEKTLGKEHPSYATTLYNLGNLYESLGQYDKAEGYLLECKQIQEKTLGKEHPSYASTLNNLGNLYESLGQYEKAEGYYLESKEIMEKTLGKEHPDYARTLNNLGSLYGSIGQYDKAEGYLLECKQIQEKTLGKEHPSYATTLYNLGSLYESLGQYDKAEGYLLECKQIEEKTLGKEHPSYAITLSNLGSLYISMGQYDKAETLIDTAMHLTQQNLRKSVQFLSENDLGEYLRQESAVLRYIPSYLNTGKFSIRMAALAYDDALFQKGFLQTVARRLKTLTTANPEADSLAQLLASYRKRLSAEYTKPIVKRGAEVAAMENRANELESRLARVVAGYSEALQQVKWQEVQAALKPGEAAIEFLQFRVLLPRSSDTVRYAALILRQGMEAPVYVNLCDERAIDSLMIRNIDRREDYVRRLYAAADRGIQPSKGKVRFRSLYDLLWSPLERHLQGVHTVYFANAGLLHRINLGAVTVGLDTVLADRYKLVELGSTRSLVIPEKSPAANRQALVMGGIQYDSDSTALRKAVFALDTMSYAQRSAVRFYRSASDSTLVEYWGALPFTSREADNISSSLKKNRVASIVLKGYDATEEAFYKSVRLQGTSPRIIHLATHGYFLPDPKLSDDEAKGGAFRLSEHPLIRSGLILAGGNHAWTTGEPVKPDLEDGILTAYEISRLNLTGTELAVLSACETGLGDIQGNEGVYGLQRAFKIAGVRYVIMSLWQVPDEQSNLFMKNFYQRWLDQGMSIPEAFRQTQVAMRQNGWSHHQWAGFVLLE
jgi:CHAT domain-containing protein/lipopolysaccharide biosynthesis regulator YciM